MLHTIALAESDNLTWARGELQTLYALLRGLRLPWAPPAADQRAATPREQRRKAGKRLRSALTSAACVDGVEVWRSRLLSSVSLVQFGGLLSAATSLSLSPRGPGCCDFNRFERAANVITSLPYAAVGVHSLKHRRTAAGKLWGASMLGVCGASITFHSSAGRWRELGRRLDYWAIGMSSALLTRALYPRLPPAATAASLAATPFRPFLVSAGNALAMEASFLRRALANPDLRGAQKLHSAACVAGMAIFVAEDASVPHVPLVHASWHCLSALSTGLINCVLADAEATSPQFTLDALEAPPESRQQQRQQQQQQRLDAAPAGPAA